MKSRLRHLSAETGQPLSTNEHLQQARERLQLLNAISTPLNIQRDAPRPVLLNDGNASSGAQTHHLRRVSRLKLENIIDAAGEPPLMILDEQDNWHGLRMLRRNQWVRFGRAEGINPIMILIDLPDSREAGHLLVVHREPPVEVARPASVPDSLGLGEARKRHKAAMLGLQQPGSPHVARQVPAVGPPIVEER